MDPYNILVVDNEVSNLNALIRTFRREHNVFSATNEEDALAIMERNDIALVIANDNTSGMNGIGFLEMAARKHPDTVRIILIAYDRKLIMEATSMEYIHSYITKPWEPEETRAVVKEQLHAALLRQISEKKTSNNRELVETLEQRRRSRVDVGLECTVKFHQTNDEVECITRNISELCIGIMIVTSDPRICAKGNVDVIISIPSIPGDESLVMGTGRIVWYSEGKEPFRGDTGYIAGILVDSMSLTDRRRLEQAMKRVAKSDHSV